MSIGRREPGWRLAVRHVTTSRYAGEVFASYNEARLTPANTDDQIVIEAGVDVTPSVAPRRYLDYWGTTVHAFDVHTAHTELMVVGSAIVDTWMAPPGRSADWDELADRRVADEFFEFLAPSPVVEPSDALGVVARTIRTAAVTPQQAAAAAIACVRERMVYGRGHTTATTPASEAWAHGSGVCQDFAHVALALLRATGIPARYVSGYIHPDRDAAIGDTVTGESHAWIEAWLGSWTAFDPTNGDTVGRRHVLVARGRDYTDVAPLRGVYTGAPAGGQDVVVELTRLS